MNKSFICISILLISSINSDYIKGIDVSTYQGNIDWNAVKNEVGFAIIRMGWGQNGVDDYFETNYNNAKAAGVQIGSYLFSYAKDSAGAEAEANHALSLLQGKQFEWPIYYDIEADALNGDVNGMANTFCQILQQNNYFCGIYSSASPLSTEFDGSVLSQYAIWVANYGVDYPSFSGDWGIWQYSSEGSVSGISGNVDMDYAQINYADIIMSKGFNGY
jgi:GH25 family lysozyme M1 (1,4-beta-N-acetylmuramidase)